MMDALILLCSALLATGKALSNVCAIDAFNFSTSVLDRCFRNYAYTDCAHILL